MLQKQGDSYIVLEEQEAERGNLSCVTPYSRLKVSIDKLNPTLPENPKEQAVREVLNLPHQTLIENNETFHRMLIDGVGVEYQKNGDTIGGK